MTDTKRIAGLEARYEALLEELGATQLHEQKIRERVIIAYAKLVAAKKGEAK
jgi:hypothetical protein